MNIPEREQGQGLVEYALLLALIALIVLVILTVLGTQVVLAFARVAGGLNGDKLDVANNDRAVIVNYESSGGGGNCTISNIYYVGVNSDGSIITNDSVPATIMVNGQPRGSLNGSAGSSGLANHAGSVSFSGSCSQTVTLE